MKTTLTSLALVLAFGGFAHAGEATCTAEALQAKALEVATEMQALAATNPSLMQEVMADMQAAQTQAATAADGDFTVLCETYDTILAKME